jgi:hypothetical protein
MPAWLHKVFQSRRIGGVAGSIVGTAKRLMPNSLYEKVRNSISRPVRRVSLSKDQIERVESLLKDDTEQFYEMIHQQFWTAS